MISVILEACEETRKMAKEIGFVERTVLIRREGGMSTEENRRKIERDLMEIKPYQFFVGDFWGMGPD